jgi:hypothetical protein
VGDGARLRVSVVSQRRAAGSSTWMTRWPDQEGDLLRWAARQPRTAGRRDARRPKLQFTMVTGPVSMPFTGLVVADCARRHSSTVIGAAMLGGAARIGGRVHRLP